MGLAWGDIHGKEKVYYILLLFLWGISFGLQLIIVYGHHLVIISDYYHLKRQIESELVDAGDARISKSFLDLPKMDQQSKLKDRLKKYCQKVYLLPLYHRREQIETANAKIVGPK